MIHATLNGWMGYYPSHEGQTTPSDRLVYELEESGWAQVKEWLGHGDDDRLQHQLMVLATSPEAREPDLALVVCCPLATLPKGAKLMGYSMPTERNRQKRVRCSIEGNGMPTMRRLPGMKLTPVRTELRCVDIAGAPRRCLVLRVPALGAIEAPKQIQRGSRMACALPPEQEKKTVAFPAGSAMMTIVVNGETWEFPLSVREAIELIAFKKQKE